MAGFRVAGKTATAQKADPATGKYSPDKYTASFVGFVPADRPRLVIAVVLDEPMIGRYGGDLAGPVFRRVAEASLRYLGVASGAMPAKVAKVTRSGDPADVTKAVMTPAPVPKNDPQPAAPAPIGPPAAGTIKVPDAAGMAARDAVRAMSGSGLVPEIEGTGRLVRQHPGAGALVPKGTSVRLFFEPPS